MRGLACKTNKTRGAQIVKLAAGTGYTGRSRVSLLLASSSVAALLVGAGTPAALAAPCTNQITASFDNPAATTVANVCVKNTSFSGNITNEGTISPSGITFQSGTISGFIQSSGVINGGISLDSTSKITSGATDILLKGPSFNGGIANSGTLSTTGNSGIEIGNKAAVITTFGGGITNFGTISSNLSAAIGVGYGGPLPGFGLFLSTFSGGVTNSGAITGWFGVLVSGVTNFSGNIVNSSTGTISATSGGAIGPEGILAQEIPTFAGGITNAGKISGQHGIYLSSIAQFGTASAGGGIMNTGTISAEGTGIFVKKLSTFSGGISNTGGTITGNTGISVTTLSTFLGGITNTGTISVSNIGIGIQTVGSFAGGISNSNGGTITGSGVGILANGFSLFSNGITNAGKIVSGSSAVEVANFSTFSGGITNSGTISGYAGIELGPGTTFSGGITNSGTVSVTQTGIHVSGISTFSSGITNSGTISAVNDGIYMTSVSTFSGGISNAGTITAGYGSGSRGNIYVIGVSTFLGGISNSGVIVSNRLNVEGIYLGFSSGIMPSFGGGITNSGTISARVAMQLQNIRNFTGGFVNSASGKVSAFSNALWLENISSFSGGISNAGTITSTNRAIDITVSTFSNGVTNSGTISAGTIAIYVRSGSTFSGGISNGGTIAGATAVSLQNVSTFLGGITNSGTIWGKSNEGIYLQNDANFSGGINNAAGGTITASGVGIDVNGGNFANGITNTGKIVSSSSGIEATNFTTFSGGITNSGTIGNSSNGIVVAGKSFSGDILNSGTITATNHTGIQVFSVSTFTGNISNSGTITGKVGILLVGVPGGVFSGNISNSGTISATLSGIEVFAVTTFSGGITNSGTISSKNRYGIFVNGVSSLSSGVANSGTISSTNKTGIRIDTVTTFSGGITNSSTGTISGRSVGLFVVGVSTFSGGISNAGTISALNTAVLFENSSPTFSGNISNSGKIVATSEYGVYIDNVGASTFTGSIVNSGTIIGAQGLDIISVGNSTFTGGITNSGTISGRGYGLYINNVGFSTFTGAISNSGTIAAATGTAVYISSISKIGGGISNTGTISGVTGIVLASAPAVSMFDSGIITGSGGTAVQFGAGTNTFTLGPGYAITGRVSGAGSDVFQLGGAGTGAFDLSKIGGMRQYEGFTTFNVVSGVWVVSNTFVQSQTWNVNGGTLAGTGTLPAVIVNNGGTLEPGAIGTPGTMTITGNLTFNAGSTYLVQVTPATSSLAVTGTASLTGGTVNADFLGTGFVSKQYTILTSTGGLGGTTFAGLTNTNLPAGSTDSLSYNTTTGDNTAYLNLTAGFTQYNNLNGNQQYVANTLTNYFNSNGGIPAQFFGLSPFGLTQSDGEVATGAEGSVFGFMNEFLGQISGDTGSGGGTGTGSSAPGFTAEEHASLPDDVALAYASILKAQPKPPTFDQRWTAWGSAFGGASKTDGNAAAGSNTTSAGAFGVAAGMDYHAAPGTVYGFALAGGGTNWSVAQNLGSGRSDAFEIGVHGTTHAGPAYLSGALAFANHWVTTNRTAALGDQLRAKFDAQSYAARLEGGYRYAVTPTLGFTPYAALQIQDFHAPSYSENDLTNGGFGLSYASKSATDTRSELGARIDDPTLLGTLPLVLRGRVAWAHDWVSTPSLNAAFQTLPGSSFTVNGAALPKNSALTSAGADLYLSANWTLSAKFDGEFATGSQTYAGTGTLRYSW